MNLHQLEYYIAVIDEHSINKAANRLYISHTALDKSIKNFEKELGYSLIIRSHKGIEITPRGQRIYQDAKKFLNLMDSYIEKWHLLSLHDLQATPNIQICFSSFINSLPLIDAVAELVQYYPTFRCQISEHSTSDIIKNLKSGDAQIAIIPLLIQKNNPEQDLLLDYIIRKAQSKQWNYAIIHQSSLLALFAKSHPLLSQETIDSQNLGDNLFVMPNGEPHIIYALSEIFPNNHKLYLTGSQAMYRFIEKGAFSIIPADLSYDCSTFYTAPVNKPLLPKIQYALIYTLNSEHVASNSIICKIITDKYKSLKSADTL